MIKVEVPATTANIGPGFDCFGIALNLFNTFYFEEQSNGVTFEGCLDKYKNEDNLVYTALLYTLKKLNFSISGIKITFDCSIPLSSGLGSSSTCVLAGVLAANKLSGNTLSKVDILEIATEIEGHPDNITPALFGGFTIAIVKDKVLYKKAPVSEDLLFVAMTPNFTLDTSLSRSILPSKIDFIDGVHNIGTASFVLFSFLNKEYKILRDVCNDKVHENYRAKFIPNFYDIKKYCKENNFIATFLSGAGPTIITLLDKSETSSIDQLENYLGTLNNGWTARVLSCINTGAKVFEL